MADSKLDSLAADAEVTGDELLYMVNDPSGTPSDRKIAVEELMELLGIPAVLIYDETEEDFLPSAFKASDRHKVFIGPADVDPDGFSGVTLNENDEWRRWD